MPGLGAEEGAQALRRARRRLARRAEGGGRADRLRDLPGFGAKAEQNILALDRRLAESGPRGRVVLSRGAGGRQSSCATRCASTRPPTAWRSPAAPAAWPTAARTWTSSPPPATPRRWPRPSRDAADRGGRQAGRRRRARQHQQRAAAWTCGSSPPENFGNLLQHFTGSEQHNEALRTDAVRRGLHVSEYGVKTTSRARPMPAPPRRRSTSCSAWTTSRPSCARTAASWRPRASTSCPELIEFKDIKGDLHSPHDRLRRTQHDPGDGRGGHRRGHEVPRDHRPLGDPRLRRRRLARQLRRHIERVQRSTTGSTASRCSRAPRSTSCPTAHSTTRTTCSRSWTG